jgi:hypothetical protein
MLRAAKKEGGWHIRRRCGKIDLPSWVPCLHRAAGQACPTHDERPIMSTLLRDVDMAPGNDYSLCRPCPEGLSGGIDEWTKETRDPYPPF